jgi:hypothetical protein
MESIAVEAESDKSAVTKLCCEAAGQQRTELLHLAHSMPLVPEVETFKLIYYLSNPNSPVSGVGNGAPLAANGRHAVKAALSRGQHDESRRTSRASGVLKFSYPSNQGFTPCECNLSEEFPLSFLCLLVLSFASLIRISEGLLYV